jgi:Ca-activated chloride channel family protein
MFKLRCVLGLFVMLMISDFLSAAEGEYTIRSNVSEVRVMFTAADAQGRRITQLQPQDVAIVDNDEIIRRFRSFGPVAETPLHVMMLIDTSSSVTKQIAKELALVEAFVHGAKWRKGDQVSILAFGGPKASVVCKATCQDQPISFSGMTAGGMTPLYDAVIAALALVAESRTENSRAAIVLISDGLDTLSDHSLQTAISAAQQAEASVYAINSRANSGDGRGASTLERMAEDTGGLTFVQDRGTAESLNAIIDDLRQGFLLTYELPRSASVRHEIRVVPTINSKLRFRSRKGYMEPERANIARVH